ncbi:hypothetical protein [Paracoccus sp. (in: a-proteobacteria)]|uniref:hypothetical protein n=1 Tax=Paracoccus sp. TaxID=267 RepID=UPI002AFFEB1E|nr:hypothetical protein [Paracoccus sp. (in: a-proteobacteria)]
MNSAERLFFVGAAITLSAGPLSSLLLLPMAWDSLLDGRLLRAAGLIFTAVVMGAVFGMLVAAVIDSAFRSGMAAQRALDSQMAEGGDP